MSVPPHPLDDEAIVESGRDGDWLRLVPERTAAAWERAKIEGLVVVSSRGGPFRFEAETDADGRPSSFVLAFFNYEDACHYFSDCGGDEPGSGLSMVHYTVEDLVGLCGSLREDIIRDLGHNFCIYLASLRPEQGLVSHDIVYSSGGETLH